MMYAYMYMYVHMYMYMCGRGVLTKPRGVNKQTDLEIHKVSVYVCIYAHIHTYIHA